MAFFRKHQSAALTLNPKGFVMIYLLALMPLLMSALTAYLLMNTSLQTWMESSHICRTTLLETQKNVSADLEKLLALNPSVKTVRLQIATTRVAIAAAIAANQGYALPQLYRLLVQFENQEHALGVAQKALIASANLKMLSGPQKVETALRKQYLQLTPRLAEFVSFKLINTWSSPTLLAVKPDHPNRPAAIYELKNNFKRQQSLQVFWKTQLHIQPLQWTKNWFHFKGEKKDSCVASLEQKEQKWISILNEDKFLSKP